jgi:hypothetical protein
MHMGRGSASQPQGDTGDDDREAKAGAAMMAKAPPAMMAKAPPAMVTEAPACVPPRTVGSMAPLTIAPHTVTTPHALALNLLDHARLGWRCKRGAWQSYRRCWGSPKHQHGAAEQRGSHRSQLKSTHVISPWCGSARCTIDAIDPPFRRCDGALTCWYGSQRLVSAPREVSLGSQCPVTDDPLLELILGVLVCSAPFRCLERSAETSWSCSNGLARRRQPTQRQCSRRNVSQPRPHRSWLFSCAQNHSPAAGVKATSSREGVQLPLTSAPAGSPRRGYSCLRTFALGRRWTAEFYDHSARHGPWLLMRRR